MRISYKFKLYRSKKNRHLIHRIEVASEIWNHSLALRRRYYRRFKKSLGSTRIQSFIAKLVKRSKYSHWKILDSQAIQDVNQRMDKGYQRFFDAYKVATASKKSCRTRPPKFKSRHRYKSYTLKQTGYQYLPGSNQITIGDYSYKFHQSRQIQGTLKTLTIKRNPLGELFLHFSCHLKDATVVTPKLATTGQRAGFDFGLTTFLTDSEGKEYVGLQAFKKALRQVKKANQAVSTKKKGSKNREKARLHYARIHQNIVHQREEFQWKLARQLLTTYDTLYFETLDFQEMKSRWGRKLSDLAPAKFLDILKYLATKHGKTFQQIDRWFPSTKRCHRCFYKNNNLRLQDRSWACPSCQTLHRRDLNAAKNIEMEGVGTSTPSIDVVSQKPSQVSAFIDSIEWQKRSSSLNNV